LSDEHGKKVSCPLVSKANKVGISKNNIVVLVVGCGGGGIVVPKFPSLLY
jgi:hypothetical protein